MHRGTKIVIVLIVVASLFAGVTLYVESSLRDAFQRRLLVVRATNTLSTDAPPEARIPADFGPHCAKASFAQSGALIVDADVIPTNAIGVVYLHYVYPFDGTFVGSNTGGDNVRVFFFRANGTSMDIVSAVNASRTLFRMENRNSSLFIGGVLYDAGREFRATFTTPARVGANSWNVQETYAITSMGFTTVTVQPPGPCG
jgi:hypothetical protein